MRMICHARRVTGLIFFPFLFGHLSSGHTELNIFIFIDIYSRSSSVLVISPISTYREHNHRQYDTTKFLKTYLFFLSLEYKSG